MIPSTNSVVLTLIDMGIDPLSCRQANDLGAPENTVLFIGKCLKKCAHFGVLHRPGCPAAFMNIATLASIDCRFPQTPDGNSQRFALDSNFVLPAGGFVPCTVNTGNLFQKRLWVLELLD